MEIKSEFSKGGEREAKSDKTKWNNDIIYNRRSSFSGCWQRKKKVFEKFLFFPVNHLLLFSSLYHCPSILLGSGVGAVWDGGWGTPLGHRVSLQWHSSLYICLLSRGISCWPKPNGCPSARHLQYCRMVEGKWGKTKNKLLASNDNTFVMVHSQCMQNKSVGVCSYGAERPAS